MTKEEIKRAAPKFELKNDSDHEEELEVDQRFNDDDLDQLNNDFLNDKKKAEPVKQSIVSLKQPVEKLAPPVVNN